MNTNIRGFRSSNSNVRSSKYKQFSRYEIIPNRGTTRLILERKMNLLWLINKSYHKAYHPNLIHLTQINYIDLWPPINNAYKNGMTSTQW